MQVVSSVCNSGHCQGKQLGDLDIPAHAIFAMRYEVVAEIELVIGVSEDG